MASKSDLASKYEKNRERISLGATEPIIPLPNLTEAQEESYGEFLKNGLKELFDEIIPVTDHLGKLWTLNFKKLRLAKPNRSVEESKEKGLSYDAPLYITAELTNKLTGEIKEQELFVAEIPQMTDKGTFIINGTERVVVHQILRAEGVLYLPSKNKSPDRVLYSAKLMPQRGAWYEFDVNKAGVMSVKLINKRPKILVTTLLRAYGYSTDDEIRNLFAAVDTGDLKFVEATLRKDASSSKEEAVIDIYRKLRPEDSVTLETAEKFIRDFFFDPERFYLGEIGRYQLNNRLDEQKEMKEENYELFVEDLVNVIRKQIRINNADEKPDDVDHLSNRRIRTIGELLARKVRLGMRRMEKNIRDRMSLFGQDETDLTPSMLVSPKPISVSIHEFFATNPLSHYLDQENILSEIKNKRTVTASGPGGVEGKRASFSVRDVHYSHYSRFCPVTTPEGPMIGIRTSRAIYAKINKYGFVEAPFRRVEKMVKNNASALEGRIASGSITNPKTGTVYVKSGKKISDADARKIAAVKEIKDVMVKPFVTDQIDYISPSEENKFVVTVSTVDIDEDGNIKDTMVPVRAAGHFSTGSVREVTHIDVDPSQIASLGLALIPFPGYNDSARTLMGSNMQRQAVPLIKTDSPIVGTGFEKHAAKSSGYAVYAPEDGVISYVDGQKVEMKGKSKKTHSFDLFKFDRSNNDTSWSQIPRVELGQKVKEGDLLIDGPSMQFGELALGANLTAALMSFEGGNYEDSIIISHRLVRDDVLTSIHIKEYIHEVRETKLGPEILTRDIPNVSEQSLRNLDGEGIVRVGALVDQGDVLVGCIAPKGEVDLSPEERLLRSIFGEFAHDVRDNSLRVPPGQEGIITKVQILDKGEGDKLPTGTIKRVKVWVARIGKISVGDKLAGRYGDKGVIAQILPEEDMPYLEDGTPVDIILTPFFIKRMNIGQLFEASVGRKAQELGVKVAVPNFKETKTKVLDDALKELGIDFSEKMTVYDGKTGQAYKEKITVGTRYIMKLDHLAKNKMYARSTGPYTLVTQQPLGGKSQMGGQRFGEMEVWALEAHGASHTLQEMLTIKSDDVVGRSNAYKSIIHGEPIEQPSAPASFQVLVNELRALGMKLSLLKKEGDGEKEVDAEDIVQEEQDIEMVEESDVEALSKEKDDAMEDASEAELESVTGESTVDSKEKAK